MGEAPDNKTKKRAKAGLKSRLFALGVIVTIAVVLLSFGYLKLGFISDGPLDENKVVFVEPGMGLNQAAYMLHREGAISNPFIFRMNARLFEDRQPIKTGEYEIPADASMADILALLQSGDVILHRFTVPEGATVLDVIDALKAEERLAGTIAEEAIEEGSLLPETYFFARGDERQSLISRMQIAMRDALANIWRERADDLPLGTPRDALILASIIEKETGLAEERRLVAGVFINRLRRNIRLQSDPTVIYGIAQGRLDRPISVRDLDSDTAYNTYRIRGLPVGPIANPGVESLRAAVQPEETDALYFVADGNGGHAFARTLSEHNANVRKWRLIKAKRRREMREVAQ
ncbi:MAG: endolytic transglycosylase MltG [Sphingomonadales bacterium]